jgi:hypothetical protein
MKTIAKIFWVMGFGFMSIIAFGSGISLGESEISFATIFFRGMFILLGVFLMYCAWLIANEK